MAIVKHYGIIRRSGRYPWGSGQNPYQRSGTFLEFVAKSKKDGLSDKQIADKLGISLKEFREQRSIEVIAERAADRAFALRLKDKGYSDSAIGRRMGINESSVRSLLDDAIHERQMMVANTATVLRNAVDDKQYIDIGMGVEQHLGISRTKFDTSVRVLLNEGYTVHSIQVEQPNNPGKFTTVKVLAPPGSTLGDVSRNREKISLLYEYHTDDGGRSYFGIEPVVSVNGQRVLIRYGDQGGVDKDGVIELRRGVPDISLGDSAYAQVRVGVDGTHYMKGMAMYGEKFPKGIDIIYNTKKPTGTPKGEVFKGMEKNKETGEVDVENPFGTAIRQKHYIDADGNRKLSSLNIVGYSHIEGSGEEGSWGKWSKNLSSQILSKQTPALAKKQLDLDLKYRQEEFDEIMSLTNPTVRKILLKTYSDEADSAAVHLKAAALPRQRSQVLLPFLSLKENEVYAPNFRNEESVVLIRHPHGGIFEIPELRVNNKNAEAIRLIGRAKDAVGINPKVASILSGADFDGDTVIVIPNKPGGIRRSSPLVGLKDFDPVTAYPYRSGMKVIKNKDLHMGNVSNLITDMTIKGASHDEIARAIRHSMVVIDAEKHRLNYQQSYLDNGIAALKDKYQGGATRGASTLISRASSEIRVDQRREGKYVLDPVTGKRKKIYIDPDTGEKLYEPTGKTYTTRTGETKKFLTKITRMEKERDARKLSSGTVMEDTYAGYANSLKAMANKARLKMVQTKDIPYSKSAAKTYKTEVDHLTSQLALVLRNKPLERQATLLANKAIAKKRKENPDLKPKDIKKLKAQAIEEARTRVGAKRQTITISKKQWDAIQAGAVSPSKLFQILQNSDIDVVKQKALPKYQKLMTSTKMVRARTLLAAGHTRAEVADALGVSVSTLDLAMEE